MWIGASTGESEAGGWFAMVLKQARDLRIRVLRRPNAGEPFRCSFLLGSGWKLQLDPILPGYEIRLRSVARS